MEQSPSWETDRRGIKYKISRFLLNSDVRYYIHKSPQLDPILS
jgi:hypothetical protein